MSLTNDIATLVGRADTLINTYETREAQINAAVQAALATVPQMDRIVYVDQITGSDAATGADIDHPVKSIERAIALGGAGRSVDIALLSDYAILNGRFLPKPGQMINLRSHGAVMGSVRRKLILGLHAAPSTIVGDWIVGGFHTPNYGVTTVNLDSIEVVFPAAPVTGTMATDTYNALLAGNAASGPPIIGLELNYCTLTRPASAVGVVMGTRTHFAALMVKSTTYVSGEMAGKWMAGVAAGATPASVGWVASNLTTL